jgi:hypothetical protein
MTKTITGLFDDFADARIAVGKLETAGIPAADISFIASDAQGHLSADARNAASADKAVDDAGRGAGMGAIVGGTGGLLTGLGLLVIPGIGPVAAAGWLAATSVGMLGGAAVGGIAGAASGSIVGLLIKAGVPDDDANVLAEGVRRGGTLVSARVHNNLAKKARIILSDQRPVDIARRAKDYRADGWSKFDQKAQPYTPAPVDRDSDIRPVRQTDA